MRRSCHLARYADRVTTLDSAHPRADIPTMGMLPELRARDPEAAARSAVLTLALFAGVVTGLTKYQQASVSSTAYLAGWATVLVLAAAAAVHLLVDPVRLDRWLSGTVTAVGGVLTASVLNLLTLDTSAAAQAFLAFPVLWAAAHLRRAAVVVVTAAAVWADCVVLLMLRAPGEAAPDLLFFGAVLVVPAVMLTRANRVRDRLVEALQEQATVDPLTGLVNRRSFDEALETTLTRPVGTGTALVLIDVDSFKTINDSYGHPVGDAVLVHLSQVLREQIRADDALVSRLGGDELAVLLRNCTPAVAERRAEDLLLAVRSTPLPLADGTLLSLSISLGVAHVPEREGDLTSLYHEADVALYDAKRGGRGRVGVSAASFATAAETPGGVLGTAAPVR
jgi:diguanylate cyclase (GGDEF)-like protein